MQQLSEGENAVLGVACGVIEVTCLQSTNYLKNAAQQGLPMTADPRVLYRGYLANVCNMGGVTGFQFFLNGGIKKMMTVRVPAPHRRRVHPTAAHGSREKKARAVRDAAGLTFLKYLSRAARPAR